MMLLLNLECGPGKQVLPASVHPGGRPFCPCAWSELQRHCSKIPEQIFFRKCSGTPPAIIRKTTGRYLWEAGSFLPACLHPPRRAVYFRPVLSSSTSVLSIEVNRQRPGRRPGGTETVIGLDASREKAKNPHRMVGALLSAGRKECSFPDRTRGYQTAEKYGKRRFIEIMK